MRHFRIVVVLIQTISTFSYDYFPVRVECKLKPSLINSDFFTTSIKIQILTTSNLFETHRLRSFANNVIRETTPKLVVEIEERSMVQLMATSPPRGTLHQHEKHLIMAWNARSLELFIHNSSSQALIFPNSNSIYLILLISSVLQEFQPVLRRLWFDFHLAKIIFSTPCVQSQQNLTIFQPFVKTSQQLFGEVFTFSEYETSFFRTSHFNSYPFRVSVFLRDPTMLETPPKLHRFNPIYQNRARKTELYGVDAELFFSLAKKLNFTPIFVHDSYANFGKLLKNGSITGSLATVASNSAILNMNGRFMMNYGVEVGFTVAYDADSLCAVVPKSGKVPKWRTVTNTFHLSVWMIIFAIYILGTTVFYCLNPRSRVFTVFWVLNGVPVSIAANYAEKKLFLVIFLGFNIILFGIIQGTYFKAFTTLSFYPDITTLEALSKSNLSIATSFYSFYDDARSEVMENLARKRIASSPTIFDEIAVYRNAAKIERKQDVQDMIRIKWLDSDGNPRLYIVNECFTSYFIAFIMPKNSPFLCQFNGVIERMVEGGFTRKWYEDVQYSSFVEKAFNLNSSKKSIIGTTELADVLYAFILLGIGLAVALFVLLGEKLIQFKTSKVTNLGLFRYCSLKFK